MKTFKIWCLKRRARNLILPWIIERDDATCGASLLAEISPTLWNNYRKGIALGRLARKLENRE